ncbi:MAG: DUF1697 domain-containing protein [Sedimentisphaerales bacterium]|jgi:uncharacterized protein (DUF1697 family)
MDTYVALFRGINITGKNILPMKDLVKTLEGIGCEKVKTYIQSGNVVFQSKKGQPGRIAGEISSRILESRGFEPKVLLLGVSELQSAIENNPFSTANGKALHLFFLDSAPDKPDLEKLTAIKADSEEFKLHGKVFYLYAPDGFGRSKLAAKVEQALGVPATARNWNTVTKLAAMVNNQ